MKFETIAREAAEAGFRLYVVAARQKDDDSNTTKGFYQWSSMAYFELATSGWSDVDKYGDWLIELADWMIDVHRTLTRERNTGYAYEGII
jgi:UDP-N-acetylmuramoyl-tripeptide--D-alanyl-D-alanine ligase